MAVMMRVNDNGDLVLSAETLEKLDSDMPIMLAKQGHGVYLVRPARTSEQYWSNTTAQQRADDFLRWVEKVKTKGPILSDEALRRESMYD